MSYCRFSCLNFTCDLYVYADASGGFTTHVAARRRIWDPPEDAWSEAWLDRVETDDDKAAWEACSATYRAALEAAPMVPIDLPHAGGTFNDASIEDLLVRLEGLRALGYHFPDHVLETLRAECAESVPAGPD